jgi:hypothetical protein
LHALQLGNSGLTFVVRQRGRQRLALVQRVE